MYSWLIVKPHFSSTLQCDMWVLQVKITSKDLSSLEKSKAIINNLTMVPKIGDVYRYPLKKIYFILFDLFLTRTSTACYFS